MSEEVRWRLEHPEGSTVRLFDREEVCSYISRRLVEEGISQVKMKEITGWSGNQLRRCLNGKGRLSVDRIEQLLWIVDGDECPYDHARTTPAERAGEPERPNEEAAV